MRDCGTVRNATCSVACAGARARNRIDGRGFFAPIEYEHRFAEYEYEYE